jgi:hypothetical protein
MVSSNELDDGRKPYSELNRPQWPSTPPKRASYGDKCTHVSSSPNPLSRTHLPRFVKRFKIEVARVILGSLTHVVIQKLLEIGNRGR